MLRQQITIQNNATWLVECDVVAKTAAGAKTMVWKWTGVIHRIASAASTAILGTPTLTVVADPNTSGWSLAFTADTTNGALAITGTGGASDSVHWLATIKFTQLTFA
jgi:hypothetical protein